MAVEDEILKTLCWEQHATLWKQGHGDGIPEDGRRESYSIKWDETPAVDTQFYFYKKEKKML